MIRGAIIIDTIIRTVVPIYLLIGLGFLSRRFTLLKAGDERVLNSYVYFFALPALFLINIAEIDFTGDTIRFVLAGISPIIIILIGYTLIYLIFRLSKETYYLLTLSTIFGSLGFFGIPFVMFAFPTTEGEHLAILSASSISVISVCISLVFLEMYKLNKANLHKNITRILKKLLTNPLILSILSGVVVSITGITIPAPLQDVLHMLGRTTATVAIFMLGAFLYGRKYTKLGSALKLSTLRMVILPAIALLIIKYVFKVTNLEQSILVLMHSMPVAISMIILSQRYDFHKETIASVILVSSLGAGIYLNLWIFVLQYL
ncbi:AEC family transporter [Chloroflexota bacterium]